MSYTSSQFRKLVQTETDGKYQISEPERDLIQFGSDGYTAGIQFYPEDIVELSLVKDETGENCFYLHFRANDQVHAEELLHDLMDAFEHLKTAVKRKVLIVCSSALTSSFFAMKLNEAAELLKIDYEFSSADVTRLYKIGFDYEAVLLTPQVSYEYAKASHIFRKQIVMKIPVQSYAKYSTGEVLNELNEAWLEHARREETPAASELHLPIDTAYRILVVGMINHRDIKRIYYRIYDHGRKTLNKEVIKTDLNQKDLADLLDYIFTRHQNIDAVVLGLPGVEENGCLTWIGSEFDHAELCRQLSEKYHHRFYLLNDVNAVALGCSAVHGGHADMLFYFQPLLSWVPGAGLIEEGRLHKGYHNAAGEMRPYMTCMVDHAEDKISDPKGALEIVAKGLLAFICTSAPKYIVLCSELTPDVQEIHEELQKYVPEEYIPPMEIVHEMKEYFLSGLLSYGISQITNDQNLR